MRTPEQRRAYEQRRRLDPAYRERSNAYARAHYHRNLERLREKARIRMAEHRAQDPERTRALAREKTARYRANPVKRQQIRERAAAMHRLSRYGLEPEVHAALLEAQRGVCAICRRTRQLVVDHDHTTGAIRGLLCHACNTGIGHLSDDVALLRAAIRYLKTTKEAIA